MFRRVKKAWRRIRQLEPGERFQTFHREQRDKPAGVKVAFFGAAFVAFGVGVVLAFIPGPAILFFALAGALLATQSMWVGRWLDEGELWGRKALASVRRWWRARRGRPERRAGHGTRRPRRSTG